ncbi:hypothetical protein VE04_02901 [Pseudogymnoascus sp. 24MN13]|nr:hypothetical protein VE04_02901 [Pseudogymnoascus sp. 24MN13]
MASYVKPSPLPPINRYITTNSETGTALLDATISNTASWTSAGVANFFLGYCTSANPVSFKADADIKTYSKYLAEPPGLVVPNGTGLRLVDMMPGELSPMHRTTSLDYGVVLEGEVELILDGGEKRELQQYGVVKDVN